MWLTKTIETRWFLWALLCGAMALLSVLLLAYFGQFLKLTVGEVGYWHTLDDHMITMRVAENFHHTGSPYFNKGEAVAANTSLFWPIILSPIYFFFDHGTAIPVMILLSMLCSSATIALACTLMRDIRFWPICAVAIALSPAFLRYGISGWEHVPQSLFVTFAFATVAIASRQLQRLTVPFVALILASISFLFRPDSAPLILVFIGAWLWEDRRRIRFISYFKLLPLTLIPLSYVFGMLHFYGTLSPNTVNLKVGGLSSNVSHGIFYFLNPDLSGFFPVLFICILIFFRVSAFSKFFLAVCAAQTAFVVLVGGDIFEHGRFFLVLLPCAIALCIDGLAERLKNTESHLAVTALVAGSALALWHLPYALKYNIFDKPWFSTHEEQIRIAAILGKAVDPDEGSIGLHNLGISYHLPYFHIVDFLGKAEPRIASGPVRPGIIGHNKYDYDYALEEYDILATPMFQSIVTTVAAPDYVPDPGSKEHFWPEVATKAMLDRGFGFVAPGEFGNVETGLLIDCRLAARFSEVTGCP